MNISVLRQTVCGLSVELHKSIVVRNFRGAFSPRAPLLFIQHVDGNVFGSQTVDPIQIFSPDVESLVRQSGNQIDVDVREPVLPKQRDIVKNVDGAVKTASIPEIVVVKRLRTQTDTIHTRSSIALQFRLAESSG